MQLRSLWTIGKEGSDLREFEDNFRNPNAVTNQEWTINADGTLDSEPKWPLFHSSEADPDGGYRPHPYTVHFTLEEEPSSSYLMQLHYIVTTPRIPYVELNVNGVPGSGFLRPEPSDSGIMKPKHSLHTTIYSKGVIDFKIPGRLLKKGSNSMTITARDNKEVSIVTNAQAILRMDRMADAAGFYYDYVQFFDIKEQTASKLGKVWVTPSVLYRKQGERLVEKCYLYLELNDGIESGDVKLTLSTDKGTAEQHWPLPEAVAFGHLFFEFDIEDGQGTVDYIVEVMLDRQRHTREGSFRRRKKWKVFTTPHAHTDIGYTHRQWEVAERLCINIDKALTILQEEKDTTERTGRSPFTYVLDSSWALEEYLQTRDEQTKKALFTAIKAGHIGIPSNYVDLLTQFASLEDLIRNGEFTDSVFRELGLKADIAAIVDVASATGSLPAIMEGMGVKYLIHANNQDRGPFRLNGGLHKISPFYWESIDGGRMLVWLAKMYCELKKVCGSPATLSTAELGLQMWLDEYETDSYAPDAVILYGQDADNTDIDPGPVQFVKQWNETYAYPQLLPCNGSEFFEYVEANFGSELQTIKGDQGAYWEDGVGSSIVPTMHVRQAQAMLPAAETLESLAVIHHEGWKFPERHYDDAWRQVLLYDEHTWGSFMAGTDPMAVLQADQWDVKEHMADSSLKWAERLLLSAATRHSLNWNNNGREVVVFNPHSWSFSGATRVEIGVNEKVYDADTGAEIPMRVIKTSLTQAWIELWIEELQGLSYRRLELKTGEGDATDSGSTEGKGLQDNHDVARIAIENSYYSVVIDSARGCIFSCYDKELQRELVDQADMYGLGEFLYARGGEGTKLLGNHADKTDEGAELINDFQILEASTEEFSYGTAVKLKAIVPLGELAIEWILYKNEKKLGVTYAYSKQETLATEAVYVSFPFQLTDGEVLSDSQLGWVNWDKDQLPGACKEWLPLQSGILVTGQEADIVIASPDIPLFTVGQEVKGRWPKELNLSGSKVYSFVLNNYWKSNYKPSQGGEIVFRYAITSGAEITKDQAYRFGRQARQSFHSQRMSYQEFRQEKAPYQPKSGNVLAEIGSQQVVLSTMKQARYDEGFIIRLQEISGSNQQTTVAFTGRPIRQAWLTDLLEYNLQELPIQQGGALVIEVPAWGLSTIRVIFE